ncbi:MAG: alpha-amylase C-terminal beta-sheet domain-containing protein [Cyanobacteria bacterium J06621_8]
MSQDILLQGFHWLSWSVKRTAGVSWYSILRQNAQRIKDSGFTHVWFPPASDSLASEGYLPRELNKLDSQYGSELELRDAIQSLSPLNIIADIIVNHRVGRLAEADFVNPSFGEFGVAADDEYSGPKSFNLDSGEGYAPARDLDHRNPEVSNAIITWMNDVLKNPARAGFSGWRYDLVKGFAGWAVELYNRRTSPVFSVGEYFDGDPQSIVNWIDSTHPEPAFRSTAFDFPLRFALYDAIERRRYNYLKYFDRAPGVLGLWSDKAVTFIENHDTEEIRGNEYATAFPGSSKTLQGYAYILTHPGIPCVFWRDIYDAGIFYETQIKRLIAIRKAYGISSNSRLFIDSAVEGLFYSAYIRGDKGELAVKIGPGSWSPSGSQWNPLQDRLLISGQDFAVWGDNRFITI